MRSLLRPQLFPSFTVQGLNHDLLISVYVYIYIQICYMCMICICVQVYMAFLRSISRCLLVFFCVLVSLCMYTYIYTCYNFL